jgi:hypothetical protein
MQALFYCVILGVLSEGLVRVIIPLDLGYDRCHICSNCGQDVLVLIVSGLQPEMQFLVSTIRFRRYRDSDMIAN